MTNHEDGTYGYPIKNHIAQESSSKSNLGSTKFYVYSTFFCLGNETVTQRLLLFPSEQLYTGKNGELNYSFCMVKR